MAQAAEKAKFAQAEADPETKRRNHQVDAQRQRLEDELDEGGHQAPSGQSASTDKAARDAQTLPLAVKLAEERRRAVHAEAELETKHREQEVLEKVRRL